MRGRSHFIGLFAVVLFIGCSDDGGVTPDAGPGPLPEAGLDTGPGLEAGTDAAPADSAAPDAAVSCTKNETDISPDHPLVHYIGRFDLTDPKEPLFEWSGSSIHVRFYGEAITVRLKKDPLNYFNLVIDGTDITVVKADTADPFEHTISGLTKGEHTFTLVKRNEGPPGVEGTIHFLGLRLPQGGCLLPPKKNSRRMLFIGDSITAAYGNEGPNKDCPWSEDTQNVYLSYSAITARSLGADHICLACSGKGVVRSYSGSTTEQMPVMIQRRLPSDTGNTWSWSVPADVAVVFLGTNDVNNNKGDPGATLFKSTYEAMLLELRKHMPNVTIFCVIGALLGSSELAIVKPYITSVVDKWKAAGDTKIHFLEMPEVAESDLGCDWHPNVKAHQNMASLLIPAVKTAMGW